MPLARVRSQIELPRIHALANIVTSHLDLPSLFIRIPAFEGIDLETGQSGPNDGAVRTVPVAVIPETKGQTYFC